MEKEAEVAEEEAPVPEAEEGASEQSPEVDAKAREMGWKPKEEWKGDPDKWRPADDYVRRGEEILPIVRSRYEKRISELEGTLATERQETKASLARIEHMSTVALSQQRDQLETQFRGKKEAAVADGDVDTFRALDKQEREALANLDKQATPPEVAADDPLGHAPAEVRPVLRDWLLDSPWFANDAEMAAVAQAEHVRLNKLAPIETATDMADNLARVTAYVKKRYPEKFENGSGAEPHRSRVEGGTRAGGGGGASLYSKLPTDAKAQCDKFIKTDRLFLDKGETMEKDMGKARERYAKEYFGEQA